MKIWIDADACPQPVKASVFKAAARLNLNLTLVANSPMSIPLSPLFDFVQVEQGPDVADKYIADNVSENDLVITADIPLAFNVVQKKAYALDPRGELIDEENAGERLAMRDFMKDLRDGGLVMGGPAPFGQKDIQNFTNSLNKILTRLTSLTTKRS